MVAMNPMAAVGFILCGTSFLLYRKKGINRTIATTLSIIIMFGALLLILKAIGVYDAGVDRILFAEKVRNTFYNRIPNHIVPHAAVAFLLSGASLLMLCLGRNNLSQWLALPVNAIGMLSVIGYTYLISAPDLGISFVPMSFHSGLSFLLFSIALLFAKSKRGFISEITHLYAGGKAARLLLPATMIIPFVLGYFVLSGLMNNKLSAAIWLAIFVTAAIFIFGLLVWLTAYTINKFEKQRIAEKRIADEKLKRLTELKLRQTEQRYYALMNSVDGIVWEADAQSFHFTFVSEQAERILGYPLDRWMNEPEFWQNHIHEEDRNWAVNYCANTTAEGKSHQFEYRMLAADGRILWMRDIVAVIVENNIPVRLSGIMVDITDQKKMEQELREKALSQQKLITEVTILAQEKERNELGLELHDNINQLLSVVKLYLGMAKTEKVFNEEIIQKCYHHLEEAMHDIRKLSHSLVTPSLGHDGLREALEDLVDSVHESNKLQVRLSIDEDYEALEVEKNKELMLYRIVQEQLNNILKYAKASEATIRIKQINGYLILSVCDNGVGFDTKQQGTGIGLRNINSRVNFYSGKMQVVSAPGQGCTLEVSIPNE